MNVKDYIENEFKENLIAYLKTELADVMVEYFRTEIHKIAVDELAPLCKIPLSVGQVADFYNVDKDTVYKWHERKTMVFHKKHGKLFTTLADMYESVINARSIDNK